MIRIRKATQKQTVAAIKSGDFSEVEKIEDTARQEAAKVFLAVASGIQSGARFTAWEADQACEIYLQAQYLENLTALLARKCGC